MARGLNKVMLIGNLGADPEVKDTAAGMAVAKFSLATTSSRKVGDVYEDETEWHRVVLFGRTAEVAGQYLRKGSKVYIEGRLKTSSWDDETGNKRYMTEVLGSELQMLDSKGEGGQPQQARQPQQPRDYAPPAEKFDDDMPF